MKFKNAQVINRNISWLNGKQSNWLKISYYFNIIISYLEYCFTGKKTVSYLGEKFIYDNLKAPLALMLYPDEIGTIISNIDTPLKNVLDIGANIGQFSLTLSNLYKDVVIDAFEPMPDTFSLLKQNATSNIHCYNFGVGEPGKQTMYSSPKRTINASLIKANATYRTKSHDENEVQVQIIDRVSKYTKRSKYDLIKIDVEGYELHTIINLKDLETRFLYIEITGQGRDKDYLHSTLLVEIEKIFGKFDILLIAKQSKSKFEALIEFKDGAMDRN